LRREPRFGAASKGFDVNGVPGWRIAAAVVVLAGLGLFAALFFPIYFHNLELQNFVTEVAARPNAQSQSDDLVRTWVLDRAYQLKLPIRADNVKISHSPEGVRIDVRYQVKVDLPGYTVNLHFYPGAGSR
jgi:hypothetical protein